MFTIDLLGGAGRPPRSRPIVIAIITFVFIAFAAGTVLAAIQYLSLRSQIAAHRIILENHNQEIAQFSDIESMLTEVEQRRKNLTSKLQEVAKILPMHTQWSPVLASLIDSVPEAVNITELLAKREGIRGKNNEIDYKYSLMIGVVAHPGPSVVEQFVQSLRTALPLESETESIRIVSQRQKRVKGWNVQYYAIECRLKP